MPSLERFFRLLIAISMIAMSYTFSLYIWSRFVPFAHSPVLLASTHLFSFTLALLITVTLLNVYVYHGFGYQPDIYRKGNRALPWVTLTFDDGPSADYTPQILDILEEYNVKATFFMVGSQVQLYPHIAQQVVDRGHEVGNHTWSHVNVPMTDTTRLYEEIVNTSLTVMDVTGVYPRYSRPARGLYDGRFCRMSDLIGHRVVLWTLSAQDWYDYRSSASITRRIVERARPGDILLFHDSGGFIGYVGGSRQHTIHALRGVIQGIRDKGLEFVPLSQFLADVEGEQDVAHM